MKKNFSLFIIITYIGIIACTRTKINDLTQPQPNNLKIANTYSAPHLYSIEDFETGKKTAYAADDITLFTGSWHFDDALVGNTSQDKKNGFNTVRLRNGFIAMNFDINSEAVKYVSFSYAKYGKDANSKFGLFRSVDKGLHWVLVNDTITCSDTVLKKVTFNSILLEKTDVRFKIQKFGGTNRINIDDFTIISNASYHGSRPPLPTPSAIPTRDDNMTMGNPSNATSNPTDSNNYLIIKDQYTLSYNNSRGEPNWVSWHSSAAWLGSQDRCDCFRLDNSLPLGYFHADTSHYRNTGFDRGHQCPSADRTGSSTDNSATFLLTNVLPQSPDNNQGPWNEMEAYCRSLTQTGNEVYTVAGGFGNGGIGIKGAANTIGGGKIAVPEYVWKVVLIEPIGNDDVKRVDNSTRLIAVFMPNKQGIRTDDWGNYRTTVRDIEQKMGYNFFSNVPQPIQDIIENIVDKGPTK